MDRSRADAGFTLIEMLVVVGTVVVVLATLGVFFLAGPSPAVASAGRDIDAAFAEARETATAFREATVVFTPMGTGYSARVYREMPGNGAFQAVNGPTYDSTVAISETAAPLGAPGFAFRVDSRGSVTGYQHFTPTDTTFTTYACPSSGAFVLALAYGNQQRTVRIPCTLSISSVQPGVVVTPAPGVTPAPDAPGTCPPSQSCGTPLPAYNATCPPGYTPDAVPYVCDSPTPVPSPAPTAPPTAPAGGGVYQLIVAPAMQTVNTSSVASLSVASVLVAGNGPSNLSVTLISHSGSCAPETPSNGMSPILVTFNTSPSASTCVETWQDAAGNTGTATILVVASATPSQCTADSEGYCSIEATYIPNTSVCTQQTNAGSGHISKLYGNTTVYDIFKDGQLLGAFTYTDFVYLNTEGGNNSGSNDTCIALRTWSPSDPATTYEDPNLP